MRLDFALLLLRLGFGGMLLAGHGIPKLMGFVEKAATFPDPLGVSSQVSLALAVFAEVFCSAAVALGVLTRWAAIPPAITMAVAVFFVHAADPWVKKELATLYLLPFLAFVLAGGGRFTLDRVLRREEST